MLRNILFCILWSTIYTSASLIIVKVDVTERKFADGDDILIDKPDFYSVSLFWEVKWGENLRGFPLSMISTPYTHNSRVVPEVNILLNIFFYFILNVSIYKSLRIWLRK